MTNGLTNFELDMIAEDMENDYNLEQMEIAKGEAPEFKMTDDLMNAILEADEAAKTLTPEEYFAGIEAPAPVKFSVTCDEAGTVTIVCPADEVFLNLDAFYYASRYWSGESCAEDFATPQLEKRYSEIWKAIKQGRTR